MKTYWESGGIAPRILDLGTRGRLVVSFTLLPLYPRERDPDTHRIGGWVGPQNRSEHGGEEKNFQPFPGLEPPINQFVAQRYTTDLCWL
jgi:hypothetical protein